MTKITRPISIPEPTNDVDSLWRTTQVLKEAVEVIQGIRGNRAAITDEELQTAISNIDVSTGGGTSGVSSFNSRTGDVLPLQGDYDSFFLTEAEGDARYALIGSGVTSFNTRTGAVVPALGDYAAIAETFTALQTFNAGIDIDLAQPISWLDSGSSPIEMMIFAEGGALDPLYNDVLLLVDFEDGIDGSQDYFDKGPNTLTIINNTNSEVDTGRAKYGTRSMLCPDGVGDGFEVADATSWDLSGDFTLELDVYFDSFDTENQYLIEKRNGGGTQAGYTVLLDTNEKFRFIQWAGSGGTESVNLTGTTTALTGQWYTVRVTCDNDVVSLYVQGSREDQDTRGAVGLNNEDVYFGFYHLDTGQSLRGSMDNVRVTLASRGSGVSYTLPTDSYPTAQGISGLTIGDQAHLTTIDSDLDVDGLVNTTGFVISQTGFEAQSSTPGLTLVETDGAADEKEWAIFSAGSNLQIQTQTDVGGAGINLLTAQRGAGTAITSLDITPNVNIAGDLTVGGLTDNIDFNPGTQFDIEFGSLVTDTRYGVASSVARHIFGAPVYVPESAGGANEVGWGQFYAKPEAGDVQTPAFKDAAGNEYELNVGTTGSPIGTSGISDEAVTNAKLAHMGPNTVKARQAGTTGDPSDVGIGTNSLFGRLTGDVTSLTGLQVNTILPNFSASADGLAPASGGGTTDYLRADGTWADPTTAAGNPGPEVYFNTAGNSIPNTTYKDDLAIVNISLDADTYYFFELAGFLINQSNGLRGRFQFSSNPQDDGGLTWTSRTSRTAEEGGQENDIENPFEITNTDTFAIRYRFHAQGWFHTNATTGGTLKLQWARISGTLNSVEVSIGTCLRLYKI